VQSWDTANKASELSDFGVCMSGGIKGKNLYLLHILRKRMEYPELKRAVREQCEAFAADVVVIEDKASGTQLIQELVAEGMHAVTRYQPQAANRQGHPHARPDCDDRQRVCLSAKRGGVGQITGCVCERQYKSRKRDNLHRLLYTNNGSNQENHT